MSESPIHVSVIIVSWNVASLLRNCLESLKRAQESAISAGTTWEIIVVDSASKDETVALLKQEYPEVSLFAQQENVGFTRGNNIGLAAARGCYLLLLNPDTEVCGDAIQQMVRFLEAHPQVGIVGPHTLNTDGSTQSSRRRFLNRRLLFLESTWLQSWAPQRWFAEFYVSDPPDAATLEVDWVQGSALMARRAVYEQIGGLDEQFVMYFEEQDWCRRAKARGWQIWYLGDAKIIHHGGKSSDQIGAFKHIHYQRSRIHYARKYYGETFAVLLRIYLRLLYSWQIGLEALKAALGSQRAMRRERIRTYWQVLRAPL